MRFRWLHFVAWLCSVAAWAQDAEEATPLNLDLKTLGGLQYWSDELVFHDWRIQRNVLTDHYRLLDGDNTRRVWGSFAVCQRKLDELRADSKLPPLSKRVVLTLHGVLRSRNSMDGIVRHLREHDLTVMNVSYASAHGDVAEHAAGLARVMQHLPGVEEVDFVAHSLGNLVIRHYLADRQADRTPLAVPRIRRIVMLGPPNNGSDLATRFKQNGLFRMVWGKSGQGIAADWAQLQARLAVPGCEFGIIAGGSPIKNPLLNGDSDFVVTVEETKLPGARDFIVVPVFHSTMKNDPKVQEYTLRFLQHGYFVAEESRKPLTP